MRALQKKKKKHSIGEDKEEEETSGWRGGEKQEVQNNKIAE